MLVDLKDGPGYIPLTYCEGIEALGGQAGPSVAPPRGDWLHLTGLAKQAHDWSTLDVDLWVSIYALDRSI